MELQFFKFGKDYKRFLQLRWFYWLSWLCSFGLWSSALELDVAFFSVWTFLPRCDGTEPAFEACCPYDASLG